MYKKKKKEKARELEKKKKYKKKANFGDKKEKLPFLIERPPASLNVSATTTTSLEAYRNDPNVHKSE